MNILHYYTQELNVTRQELSALTGIQYDRLCRLMRAKNVEDIMYISELNAFKKLKNVPEFINTLTDI